jgi:riboflavin transporter FmnP
MRTIDWAAGVVFAALAVALNFTIRIPAPFAPFLYYQIWEIPLVAAFFLFGTQVLLFATGVNTIVLLIFFPGALPLGPIYNMAAVLSMMVGVGFIKILLDRHTLKNLAIATILYTSFGIVARTAAMSLVNYVVLRYPSPVGFSLPEPSILIDIPLIVVFNATLALYTVPIGYSVAKTVATVIRTSAHRAPNAIA